MKLFKQLNDGKMPEDYELAILRKWAPEPVKKALINPYLRQDGNQIRITMRLIESAPTLNRKALINKINTYLVNDMKFASTNVHPTGMAVLYNNLLQSLYKSQILTLGVVFISILGMFIVLFRSVSLAILAIIPNLLAACSVLGLMGWIGIPLDIMTITIAAITVGIAVDHAIHYIHRFQVEFVQRRQYLDTIQSLPRQHWTSDLLYRLDHHRWVFHFGLLEFYPNHVFWVTDRVCHADRTHEQSDLIASPAHSVQAPGASRK